MGDQINRDLFLDPSLVEDADETDPLLDQAIRNVEEQAIDNLEQDRSRPKPIGRKVDGIVFGEGPAEEK